MPITDTVIKINNQLALELGETPELTSLLWNGERIGRLRKIEFYAGVEKGPAGDSVVRRGRVILVRAEDESHFLHSQMRVVEELVRVGFDVEILQAP